MPRNGQWIRPLRRRAIHLRDAKTCVYCDRWVGSGEARLATLDHIYDRMDHSNRNLVTACHDCNSRRQATPLNVWVPDVARRRRIHEARYRNLDPYIQAARIELEIEARVARGALLPAEVVERALWSRVQDLVEAGALQWTVDPHDVIPADYRRESDDPYF